jgi:arylsulfatase A-like enzyme
VRVAPSRYNWAMPTISRRGLLAGVASMPGLAQEAAAEARMNLIVIVADTWGAHWVGCYGANHIRTPHIDALARKSARFLQCHAEALPTIPARRALYTGRRIFPSELIHQPDDPVRIRGWHQLYAEDVTLAERLAATGYTTALVSDVYHQFKPGKNFHRGFDSWTWIRGQEADRLVSGPRKGVDLSRYLHSSQRPPVNWKGGVPQYLRNRRDWKSEADWFAPRVFGEAARWLTANVEENQPFYLHIESFTPHEFWDPPLAWYRQYMKRPYTGPWLLSPPSTTEKMSALELEHVRALYAGLVSFTDAQIGRFLARVEQLGLMKNTLIVFVSDHGAMMGEQGQVRKAEPRLRTQVTGVPLIVYHPTKPWAGRAIDGFVQHTDVMPTLLDLLGVAPPNRVTGESLVPLLEKNEASRRPAITIGWGEHAAMRNDEWLYVARWSPGGSFEQLYDLRRDPLELSNVAPENEKLCREFRRRLKAYTDNGWGVTRGSFAETVATAVPATGD